MHKSTPFHPALLLLCSFSAFTGYVCSFLCFCAFYDFLLSIFGSAWNSHSLLLFVPLVCPSAFPSPWFFFVAPTCFFFLPRVFSLLIAPYLESSLLVPLCFVDFCLPPCCVLFYLLLAVLIAPFLPPLGSCFFSCCLISPLIFASASRLFTFFYLLPPFWCWMLFFSPLPCDFCFLLLMYAPLAPLWFPFLLLFPFAFLRLFYAFESFLLMWSCLFHRELTLGTSATRFPLHQTCLHCLMQR